MAAQTPEQVIESQRQDWNRVAGGWEKWDEFFDRSMAFLNHRLVGDARLRSGMHVLDLGSGTGYPALLAAQTVGPTGGVIGVDLADQMLAAAERKARRLALSNVTFRTGDVTALPFETASFDAATSRFCLMFLPQIPKAVAEIARVLKRGAWLAAAVWSSPDQNPYLKIPMDTIKQFIELPPPDPTAPGTFRLAKSGELAAMLEAAGFADAADAEFIGDVPFRTPDEYFSSLMDIAAPIQNLWRQLEPAQQAEARRRIIDTVGRYRSGATIDLPIAVRFVAARKPL